MTSFETPSIPTSCKFNITEYAYIDVSPSGRKRFHRVYSKLHVYDTTMSLYMEVTKVTDYENANYKNGRSYLSSHFGGEIGEIPRCILEMGEKIIHTPTRHAFDSVYKKMMYLMQQSRSVLLL